MHACRAALGLVSLRPNPTKYLLRITRKFMDKKGHSRRDKSRRHMMDRQCHHYG
jgi:hypothetical protein